jgi:hypothetical protein
LLILRVETVTSADDAEQVSFRDEVVPILTKAGCNAGVCHAKAGGGQNGFELSLLGFEPEDDYDRLVREAGGRRILPTDPDHSLLLQKASGQIPHGGGTRLGVDTPEFALLRDWIAQGAPRNSAAAAVVTSLEVQPPSGVVQRGERQQLAVAAHYSDGSVRDVTRLALFESHNDAMAEVDANGLVTVHDVPGNVAIMIRYQSHSGTFLASVPLGAPVSSFPESRNFVDDLVFANLSELGIPASPVCDDSTFLRRVSLDIAGRLPTPAETESFLADAAADKRDRAIERLVNSGSYADYFANKWTALLKNRRDEAADITSNFAFHAWVRDSLLSNLPYDQFVRQLLAATGTVVGNPPVAWYKRVKDPKQQLEDVSQLFLGVRMQCAQCHHHPFERWSQDDYYGLAAFFSRVGRKPTDTRGEDLIFHQRGLATAVNVRTGEELRPAALGDAMGDIPPDVDPRLRLADWMASPENPFFARALVNRYWKHFLGRGLIEPEDDIRETNPPTNPALLTALEEHFVNSGYDLQELVRTITRSQVYQLSATPNAHNLVDRQSYSRFYPRRMQAEVLLDAIDDVAGTRTSFANLPAGTRAIALPDNSYNKASAFLRVFGRPDSTSVCECERVQSSSLAQSLHLINSAEMKAKLSQRGGRADTLSKAQQQPAAIVEEIYLAAFSRGPDAEELAVAIDYLQPSDTENANTAQPNQQSTQENLEDLIWALINTKEFLFNH